MPRAAKKDLVASLETAWERYSDRAATAAKGATDENRAKVHETINQHLVALNKIAAEVS